MSDSAVLLAVVTFVLAQAGLYLDQRRRSSVTDGKIDVASVKADTATQAAELAAKRSEPTSNGFASSVLESLDGLTKGQVRLAEELHEVRGKLDGHIGDHASADVHRRGQDA